MTEEAPYFREAQKFRQFWLWLAIVPAVALAWWGFLYQVILGREFGERPAPDWVLILIWLVFGIAFPWLFTKIQLETEVRRDGLHVKFFPFHRKFEHHPIDQIERWEARTYRPIREYGGWGLRWGWTSGKAYNVSGNRGVQLVLEGGKKLLIGSQRADELALALDRASQDRSI